MRDWPTVNIELDRLTATSERHLPDEVLKEAARLVDFCSVLGLPPPSEVGFGYDPTIRLCWTKAKPSPIEVEVTAAHYEYYAFRDGFTDIRHFACENASDIPAGLAELLRDSLGRLR